MTLLAAAAFLAAARFLATSDTGFAEAADDVEAVVVAVDSEVRSSDWEELEFEVFLAVALALAADAGEAVEVGGDTSDAFVDRDGVSERKIMKKS